MGSKEPCRLLVSAGVDLVLACGGDGTVTACAEGVTGTGVPLAIMPMETGNLLARHGGLPTGLDEALAVALGRVQQPVDAGRAPGACHHDQRLAIPGLFTGPWPSCPACSPKPAALSIRRRSTTAWVSMSLRTGGSKYSV